MSVPGQCQNFCVILSLSLIQSDRSSSLARALKPSLLFYLHLSFTRIYLVTNINCRPAGTRLHSGDKHACARHGQPLTHSANACAGGQTCEETPLKGAPEGNLSWVGEERKERLTSFKCRHQSSLKNHCYKHLFAKLLSSNTFKTNS